MRDVSGMVSARRTAIRVKTPKIGKRGWERLDLRVGRHAVLGDMSGGRNVTIHVDGKPVPAREGEPIAAALYAYGIRITRYSPHSGGQRGPFCMIGRCTECAMTVDGVPNVRTCITAVREGMRVETPGRAAS
jgi:hypothetical protein